MLLLTDSTKSMVRMFVINNSFAVNYLKMLAILVPRFLLVLSIPQFVCVTD